MVRSWPVQQSLAPYFFQATYYIPRKPKTELQGAKQPKGKLYDKYTALTKQLRLAGLRSKGSDKENQENIPEDIDDPGKLTIPSICPFIMVNNVLKYFIFI